MIVLRVHDGPAAALALLRIKAMAFQRPGEHRLVMVLDRGERGERRLDLGPVWTYSASGDCLATLGEYGDVQVEAAA